MRRALPLLAALLLTPSGAWAQEVAGSADDATVEATEPVPVGPDGSAAPTQGAEAEVDDGEARRVAEADGDGTHGADAPAARGAGPASGAGPSPGEGAPSEPAIDPEATPLDLEPPDGVAELLGLADEDGETPEPEIHETWWFWASIAAVVVGVTVAIVVDVTTDDPAPSAPAPMGLRLGGF